MRCCNSHLRSTKMELNAVLLLFFFMKQQYLLILREYGSVEALWTGHWDLQKVENTRPCFNSWVKNPSKPLTLSSINLTIPSCWSVLVIHLFGLKSMFTWPNLNTLSVISQNRNVLDDRCCSVRVLFSDLWTCCAETGTWRPICQGRHSLVLLCFGFCSIMDC